MLRLGHIEYSNCIPVHALLLERELPGVSLRRGTPTNLNRALATGEIDVAPCSSIEYARNAAGYRVLPGPAIGSHGAVHSILLELNRPLRELDGRLVLTPTASATSRVLLRTLLELRWGVRPRYREFVQERSVDPFAERADAALWIGDLALRRARDTVRPLVDLGAAWTEWTGLPFVFALWQTNLPPERDPELRELALLLQRSRRYFEANEPALAERHAGELALSPERLLEYWRSLRYRLDDEMLAGLNHFFGLAVELDEAPAFGGVSWVELDGGPGNNC